MPRVVVLLGGALLAILAGLVVWTALVVWLIRRRRIKLGVAVCLVPPILLGLCMVVAVALLPRLQHQGASKARCLIMLRQVGLACRMYAMDYDCFPERLPQLTPDYLSGPDVFVCPLRREPVAGATAASDERADYVLVAGVRPSDPPDRVLLYCRCAEHERGQVPVAHVDGSVTFVSPEALDAALGGSGVVPAEAAEAP